MATEKAQGRGEKGACDKDVSDVPPVVTAC